MQLGPAPHELRAYPELSFGGFSRCDGTTRFALRVQALLKPGGIVLDVGCGRGSRIDDFCVIRRKLQDMRGEGRVVIGIDPDPRAGVNPYIDEFRLASDPRQWPIDDSTIDLAYSDYVLEHIEDPRAFFGELARVVKPGGVVCLRTPNAFGYASVIARLVPNRWHARVSAFSQENRNPVDVFPTRYRCNRPRVVKRLAQEFGFDGCAYTLEAEPSYLKVSPFLYSIGVRVHALLPPLFQSTLVAFLRKR